MCSYLFVCKYEIPPVVKKVMGMSPCEESLFTNGDFLVILTVVFIIAPLSGARDINFLGFTSGIYFRFNNKDFIYVLLRVGYHWYDVLYGSACYSIG